MGLDMYLEKRTYIAMSNRGALQVRGEGFGHIKPNRVSNITEQIGYWRKANHIHKWFVDNVQDGEDNCRDYWVFEEDLRKLLDTCKRVRDNHDLAGELLPTQSGFFFGDAEYDDYYFSEVDKTIEILEDALSESEGDIFYTSSW